VPKSIWNGDSHLYISDYPEDQQAQLVALALRNLRAAGGEDISAFRAGGYIANSATLRALEQNGIFIDSSYNFCHLHEEFRRTTSPLLQSTQIGNVTEIPVSWFSDWPGHYRHAQITACSLPEMRFCKLRAHGLILLSSSHTVSKCSWTDGRASTDRSPIGPPSADFMAYANSLQPIETSFRSAPSVIFPAASPLRGPHKSF
jgi:hypothetical protein